MRFKTLPYKYFHDVDTCKCPFRHFEPLGPLGTPPTPKENETKRGPKGAEMKILF